MLSKEQMIDELNDYCDSSQIGNCCNCVFKLGEDDCDLPGYATLNGLDECTVEALYHQLPAPIELETNNKYERLFL